MTAETAFQKPPQLEISYDSPSGLSHVLLNGEVVAMTSRHLSELTQNVKPPHMLAIPDGVADRVLYEQHIGIGGERHEDIEETFPPFSYQDEAAMRDAGAARWRLDLTIYADGELPNGELNRSKGHINNESVEVFQVLSGAVRMYMQHPQNETSTYFTDLEAGDLRLIPPGWWHTTHVICGPSAVINIVNREGFLDWKDKRYGHQFVGGKGAAYTFKRSDGEIVPVANPDYDVPPELVAVAPTRMPVLDGFGGLLQNLCWTAPHSLLEEVAIDVLSNSPDSKNILQQTGLDGNVMSDFYEPVYDDPRNLATYIDLKALGIDPPPAGGPALSYRGVLAQLVGLGEDASLVRGIPDDGLIKRAILRSIDYQQQSR